MLLVAGALSCSDNATPSGPQRQAELLRDPFGYKMDDNDISGGNISEFDRDAFKKDIGNVLNP